MSGTSINVEIPVRVELPSESTGNVLPLLHEIKHALSDYLHSGKETIIDLRSIPMAPGDEEQILDALGKGEVTATLDALGASEIRETKYSGVWLVTHFDEGEQIIGRFIEVTAVPEIMKSQRDDVVVALSELEDTLNLEFSSTANNERHEEMQ